MRDDALMGRVAAEADALRATALGLAGAARPPADVVRLALLLIALAESLLAAGTRNVITDVGAAAEAARAAAVTARLNIEVSLRGITDPALRDSLAETAGVTDAVVARADQVVAAVRAEITR
jgi:formiminotetrahydrofolate cyclodeaminase